MFDYSKITGDPPQTSDPFIEPQPGEAIKPPATIEEPGALVLYAKPGDLDPVPIAQQLHEYLQGPLVNMKAEIAALTVTDEPSSIRANEMIMQLKVIVSRIEKEQKRVTKDAHNFKATIDKSCKAFKDEFDALLKAADHKRRAYLIEEERKRQEAERKAKAEAERIERDRLAAIAKAEAEARAKAEAEGKAKEEADAAARMAAAAVETPIPVVPEVPKATVIQTASGTTKLETEWKGTLVDLRQLPEDCITDRWEQIVAAVQPWINKQVAAGVRKIPGVVIKEEYVTKTRRK